MKKVKNKGKAYKNLYLTYLAVVCVPILFSILFYYYTYQKTAERALFYNGNLITTVKNTCDEKFQYYKGITYQLKISDSIKTMADKSFNGQKPATYWNSYSVQKNLQEINESMKINGLECRESFLYLKENDKVIASSMSLAYEMFNEELLELGTENAQLLKETLLEIKEEQMLYLRNQNGVGYIFFLQPAMRKNGKLGSGTIGIVVEADKIDIQNQSADWQGGMDWTIVDPQNRILRKTEILTGTDDGSLQFYDGENIEIENEKYLINIAPSDICDWSYVLFTPVNQVNESADEMRNVYLITLLVILVITYYLTKKAMKINYGPLENMLSILKKDEMDNLDEYEYLNSKVSFMMEKSNKDRKDIRKKEIAIRNFTLEHLLTVSKINADNPRYSKKILEKFSNGKNMVLSYSISYTAEKAEVKNQEKEKALNYFVVSNVLEECYEGIFSQETLVWDNRLITIIHLLDETVQYSEILQDLAEKIDQFVKDKFQIELFVLESGVHEGLSGIRQCYLEICQSEEFSAQFHEKYLRYEDIKDQGMRKYQYSFEMEQVLVNAIRSGNKELAISLIDNIVDCSFTEDSGQPTEMKKCLIYDIFGTLLKASEDIGVSINETMNIGILSSGISPERIREYFVNLVQSICQESKESKANSQKQMFCQEVKTYVKEHFTDPDLNISQIALKFSMSPAYLSSLYKEHTGESILDMLREYRLEYAKKLLLEGNTVAEAAINSGFRESSTFVRAFKKYTGFTPGQLRKTD